MRLREHQMVPLNLLPPAVLSLAGEQMCMLNGSIAQHASSEVVQQQAAACGQGAPNGALESVATCCAESCW